MVVLSANILPQLRLTVDEYLQADLPEGHRYELVDGIVEMSPTPDRLHDFSITRLYTALYEYGRTHPSAFAHISQRASVVIPPRGTVREPDLALYREFTPNPDWAAWKEGAPFWVAEATSPDQETRDLEEKRDDYWLAGVEEYWIIHRQQGRILVLSRGKTKWREKIYSSCQEARSTILADFAVGVEVLLPKHA